MEAAVAGARGRRVRCSKPAGERAVDELGKEIFQFMLATASGQASKSELHGYGQNESVPWQIGAISLTPTSPPASSDRQYR